MTTDAGTAYGMTKMGLLEGVFFNIMTTETKVISLLHQELRLPGIMGIMTGSTSILKGRMNILLFKLLSVMALIARLIHRLLQ
jgi:hypothetical protein